jgi:dienelactone hydrolase
MAREILDQLRAAHHPYADDWLQYAAAGHEVGEPYYIAAHSTIAQVPGYTINLGGTPQANAAASEDAWPRVLRFLNEAL